MMQNFQIRDDQNGYTETEKRTSLNWSKGDTIVDENVAFRWYICPLKHAKGGSALADGRIFTCLKQI